MTRASNRPARTSGIAIRERGSDRAFSLINISLLALVLVAVLFPLIYVVSASFSRPAAVTAGDVWLWPVDVTLESYRAIFRHQLFARSLVNSLFYTVVGTIVSVCLTVLAAYPLSRRDLVGRGAIMSSFVLTLLFSGGLIPTYLVVKDLGMLNTRWALILPAALSVYTMIITRAYFQTVISDDLLGAAQLDGASDVRILWSVVIPLSGPILAVDSLLYASTQWNQFFSALIYLTDRQLWPLQLVLREILVQNDVDPAMLADVQDAAARQNLRESLKYASIVVATVPPLLLYPFVQKYLVRGALIGSLKD